MVSEKNIVMSLLKCNVMHVSDSCFYPFWWRNLIISFFGINQPFVLHVILKDKTGNEIVIFLFL